MNLQIVSAVFPPEPIVTAKTSFQIAVQINKSNGRIKVLTNFPNRPQGKIYQGFRRSLYKNEITTQGFELLRCFSSFSTNSSISNRFLENLTFGFTSSLALLFTTKPKAIYANTWPIFAQGMTILISKIRRIPIVLSIQDIYPESLEIQGRITKRNLIYKILRWIDQINAKWATELIVISERFAKVYIEDRKIAANKVHVIPNWIDEEDLKIIRKEKAREQYNLPKDTFMMIYGGNIGAAAGIETIIEGVSKLPADSKVILLIAGEGSNLKYCQELAQKAGKDRIIFHSPWLAEETGSLLSAADVLVLPTRGNQSMVSVPSKMITYLFMGKPILAIANQDSDIAETISKSGCGWVIEPNNTDILAKKLIEIWNASDEFRSAMGSKGRNYAINNFSMSTCLPKIIDVLEKAANG
jgi:glycosyltransferase involved in cell wall biosynthesis